MRTDIAALHTRIDALYQALFNHKDPAAEPGTAQSWVICPVAM